MKTIKVRTHDAPHTMGTVPQGWKPREACGCNTRTKDGATLRKLITLLDEGDYEIVRDPLNPGKMRLERIVPSLDDDFRTQDRTPDYRTPEGLQRQADDFWKAHGVRAAR